MWHIPDLIPIQDTRAANLALGVGQEERFFNKLEDDVSRIIQQEKRREQYTNSQGQEVNTSTEHEPVGRLIEMHIHDPMICRIRKRTDRQYMLKFYIQK